MTIEECAKNFKSHVNALDMQKEEVKKEKCFCECEPVVDEIGDWNVQENEKDIINGVELHLSVGIMNKNKADKCEGFYIEAWNEEGDEEFSMYPKYCPMCGRKLREETYFTANGWKSNIKSKFRISNF